MYKQLYNITLAGLIGISSAAYGVEISPSSFAPDGASSSAKATADMTADMAKSAKKEYLVPFNQDLYKQYCQAHQGRYESSRNSKFIMLAVAGVIITMQVHALATFPYIAKLTALQTVSVGWWNLAASAKLSALVCSGLPTAICAIPGLAWKGFQAFSFSSLVSNSANNLITLSTDMENIDLWEERELLPDTQKQALWHEQIYALFGSPEIIGTTPVTGKYKLRGYKNYSIGQAIFGPFEFDPFDLEQVKTLLGLGTTRQDLRCSKIEIIVL
jgi:hypothetical protein